MRPVPRTCGATLLTAGAVLGLLAGCRAPLPPTEPMALVLRIPDYERYLDESISILRRYDFPPDYVDRPGGLVISQPATGAQWFEFWRIDTPGAYQKLESNLHTIRRVVTLTVEPLDEAGGPPSAATQRHATTTDPSSEPSADEPAPRYRLQVRVDKSRHSAPERQVTTASGALRMYSMQIPTTEGRWARAEDVRWVPLGRDGLLEAILLEKLAAATPDVTPAE